jgi:hypothetical protein
MGAARAGVRSDELVVTDSSPIETAADLVSWVSQALATDRVASDVLMAGIHQSAIRATVATCPAGPTPCALPRDSGDNPDRAAPVRRRPDDPTADLIAAGLLIALTKGGRGTGAVVLAQRRAGRAPQVLEPSAEVGG